jgi:hypothetical protein
MDEQKIKELADAIYAEKIRRARAMTPGERMEAGIELFEASLGVMRDGIRMQHPEADDDAVETILKRRLDRLRRMNDHGIYQTGANLHEGRV